MRRALVVNCSAPRFNLGAAKLANWLQAEGWKVVRDTSGPGMFADEYDLVALSVIFSWDALKAREIALECRSRCEVWCGGPGMSALANWWRQETGLECHVGLDWRFERQRGGYVMTFASRGCPVGCWFCIVPKIEGREFTLDPDFEPAPVLCDNNLSALPEEFQDHVIDRYLRADVKLKDANSGFEPATFTAETYSRWKKVLRGPWRFAFDEMGEEAEARRMLAILQDEPACRKRVYVLAGNEPVATCLERVRKVIEWGGEPHAQFVLPLNWLGDPATIRPRHDWTYQLGRDFCRWVNGFLWRSVPIEEYRPRRGEPRPFAKLGTGSRSISLPVISGQRALLEVAL